ncbi:glycosyltransferase family 39 protein [Candidatus Curtissbacteria bacterium]|nr:glycosyltransferase family 39 protein [Candidatus Curtissbacteria bacterium]
MNKFLLSVILLAAFLRFYKLDSFPVSPSWDEVAIGYNAYSIAQTARDEYGKKFPLLFQSFNDYKLPGYIYLDALFIKLFGLSQFWVRFPSALLGTLAVLSTYFLAKKLFEGTQNGWQLWKGSRQRADSLHGQEKLESKIKSSTGGRETIDRPRSKAIALLSAFLLAISPWHLQFSRAAFESNAALTIVILGLTCIFYGFKNRFLATLSVPILSLSLYFYYSPRIFVPLILVALFVIYKKEIAKNYKYFMLGVIVSLIIVVPIAVKIVSPQGLKRVQEVSIFKDTSIIEPYVLARSQTENPLSGIFLNRRIPLAFEAFHSYFSHFSPGFLFFGDDPNPRHKSVFHGNLYLVELPLLLIGLAILIGQKARKSKLLILSWLLIAPLPASLAKEFPHSLRALLMLPALIFITSPALARILKSQIMKVVFALIFALSLINYLYTYYVVYPKARSESWAYGYQQALSKASKLESAYDRIIFTGHYWKPYIFYLFESKIDPASYHADGNQESIGKYRFGTTYWDSGGKDLDLDTIKELKSGKTLLIITPQELSNLKSDEKFIDIETVYDYSGRNEIFKIGEWRD